MPMALATGTLAQLAYIRVRGTPLPDILSLRALPWNTVKHDGKLRVRILNMDSAIYC